MVNLKGIPFIGPIATGGEFLYNLATGKEDPIPAPPDDPTTEANNAVQNVAEEAAKEAAEEAGQALKEAGENAYNTLTGGFNTVKKYAGVAVAGIAGLILLKAFKK